MATNIAKNEKAIIWIGPGFRAIIPPATGLAVFTCLILLFGPWLARLSHFQHEWVSFTLFSSLLAVWAICIVRWLYRGACYVSLLTDQAIHVDYGFLYKPVPPIPLRDIETIEYRLWVWWLMDVGTLVIRVKNRRPTILPSIVNPQRVREQCLRLQQQLEQK